MPSDLSAIRERWEKATPGPWTWEPSGYDHGGDFVRASIRNRYVEWSSEDAEAIAHAPSDIAALFARIEELSKSRDQAVRIVDERNAELATLKATFTENQRERYAEEHAKVLGLEAEVTRLRAVNEGVVAEYELLREATRYAEEQLVAVHPEFDKWDTTIRARTAEAERDALRVRLGKATELLACWQALFGDDDEEKSEGFMNETRAFLSDGAP